MGRVTGAGRARRKAPTDEAHQSQPVRPEHGTRRYTKVPNRNKPIYPTTYILSYGSTWKTLSVDNLSGATPKGIERELELLRGWLPTAFILRGKYSSTRSDRGGNEAYRITRGTERTGRCCWDHRRATQTAHLDFGFRAIVFYYKPVRR